MTPHDQTNNLTPHYITRLASMQALRFRSRGFAVFRVAEIKRRATGPFCLVNLTAAVPAGDAFDQLGIIGTLKLLPSRGATTEIRQSTMTPLKNFPSTYRSGRAIARRTATERSGTAVSRRGPTVKDGQLVGRAPPVKAVAIWTYRLRNSNARTCRSVGREPGRAAAAQVEPFKTKDAPSSGRCAAALKARAAAATGSRSSFSRRNRQSFFSGAGGVSAPLAGIPFFDTEDGGVCVAMFGAMALISSGGSGVVLVSAGIPGSTPPLPSHPVTPRRTATNNALRADVMIRFIGSPPGRKTGQVPNHSCRMYSWLAASGSTDQSKTRARHVRKPNTIKAQSRAGRQSLAPLNGLEFAPGPAPPSMRAPAKKGGSVTPDLRAATGTACRLGGGIPFLEAIELVNR
jgi:hypothetical protein